jgi:hypothetical protein
MDGGRFGLLPSRGITPSMEGRRAEREAVPTGQTQERYFRQPDQALCRSL